MPDGVPEIQDPPQALFGLVLLDDAALDPQGPLDDRLHHIHVGQVFFFKQIFFFKNPKKIFIKGHGHFEGLGQTRGDVAPRQGPQDIRVDQDAARLVESADNVFDPVQIDGRLAADGGVHLGEDRGRNIVEIDPPHVGGRREARQVSADPAPDRDDAVLPAEASRQHGGQELFQALQGLVLLALLHRADHGLPAGAGHRPRIGRRNACIRHDQNLPVQVQILSDLPQTAPFDHDLIAARAQIYLQIHHLPP